jgi:hypothetical protein
VNEIEHLAGWKIIRKDQRRRLKYQENQRIQQKLINDLGKWQYPAALSEGELKSFASKLIK